MAAKLDPVLMMMVDGYNKEGMTGLLRLSAETGAASNAPRMVQDSVVVFLHCSPEVDLTHWAERGVKISAPRGLVRKAEVPVSQLQAIASDPAIDYVEHNSQNILKMDVAAGKIHAAEYIARSGLSGKGVIVGIVDSGIDGQHPAFAGRILEGWDQTLPGNGPGGAFNYGTHITGSNLSGVQDEVGHGTHVAGTAAGRDAQYAGIATNAEIVYVKTTLRVDETVDGVEYIFDVARRLGRPAVVNLSFGYHAHAHDGMDGQSIQIDSLVGPGRIVVASAGNEASDNMHSRLNVAPGRSETVRMRVPAPGMISGGYRAIDSVAIFGAYHGSDTIGVRLTAPGGDSSSLRWLGAGDPQVDEMILNTPSPYDDVRVVVAFSGPIPGRTYQEFMIILSHPINRQPLLSGEYAIAFETQQNMAAPVDLWLLPASANLPGPQPQFMDHLSKAATISSPGTAANAITVGSNVSKVSWTTKNGTQINRNETLGEMAFYSSEGPLLDGARKPDITAPGHFIVSALAANSSFAQLADSVISDTMVALTGTSMAAPVIAGVAALLLEQNPALSHGDLRWLLQQSASIPGAPAGDWDPKWGFGLIDLEKLPEPVRITP